MQHVTLLNTVGNCNTMLSIIIYYNVIILWDHRRVCGLLLTETSLCGTYLYMHNSFVNGDDSSDSIADAVTGDSNCCAVNTYYCAVAYRGGG